MLDCIINESVGVILYGAQLGVNKNEKGVSKSYREFFKHNWAKDFNTRKAVIWMTI